MKMVYRPYEEVWHPGDPKKEKMIIVVGIVTAIMLTIIVAAGWGYILGVLYEPDTETNKVVYDPAGFGYYVLTGGFTDRTGNTEELLDDIAYISSWKPDGRSEKINLQAYWWSGGDSPTWFEWYIYLDPNGNWDDPMYKSTPDSPYSPVIHWVTTPDGNNPGQISVDIHTNYQTYLSPVIELHGAVSGMALRVEWHARCSGVTYGRTVVIHDEAKILDGSGSVVVQPSDDGDDVFYEGETVTFKVSTGASGISVGQQDKGWQLRLYKPDGTQYTGGGFPMNLSDNLEEYDVNWVVPQGVWSPSGNNRWTVRLYNLLIEQSMDWFFTVDVAEKQPTMTGITVSDETPTPPAVVTVTLTGEPNSITQSPIDRFNVDVYYGVPNSIDHFIMEDALFSATNNQATFTFSVPSAGHITIEARCIDEAGRPSASMAKGIDASGESQVGLDYGPGQVYRYQLDEDINYPIFPDYKPELVRYTFRDATGKTIYVISHSPTRQKTGQSGGNQYWHVTDSVAFVIPAWAKTGTWTMVIQICDKDAWVISDQTLATRSESFNVIKGSISQNLLAPLYLHKHILLWDVNWKLPCPLVWIVIVITIVALVGIAFYQRERISAGIKELKRRK